MNVRRVFSFRLSRNVDPAKAINNLRKIAAALGYRVRRGTMTGAGNAPEMIEKIATGELAVIRLGENAQFGDLVRIVWALRGMGADIVAETGDIVTVHMPGIGNAAEVAAEYDPDGMMPLPELEAPADGEVKGESADAA